MVHPDLPVGCDGSSNWCLTFFWGVAVGLQAQVVPIEATDRRSHPRGRFLPSVTSVLRWISMYVAVENVVVVRSVRIRIGLSGAPFASYAVGPCRPRRCITVGRSGRESPPSSQLSNGGA